MEWMLQAVTAVAFLATAIAMIWHERSRLLAKRPFLRNSDGLQTTYWMTYLSLIVLGSALMISVLTSH
jgi:hypothetical protein